MEQFLKRELIIGVCVLPAVLILVFVFLLIRKTQNIKATENTLGFLCLVALMLFIPPLVYLSEILSYHRGFLGYYFSIPPVFSKLYSSDRGLFLFFLSYLLSIHAVLASSLSALLRISFIKNRLNRAIAGIKPDDLKKEDLGLIERAANSAKLKRGLSGEIETIVLEDEQAGSIIGSASAGIIKKGEDILLVISRRFADFVKKGMINSEELDAVLQHEFSHIANRDYAIPFISKAVIRRHTAIGFCISVAVYLGIAGRYDFFSSGSMLRQNALVSYPLFVIIPVLALSFCLLFGTLIWLLSWFLQRREILADNLALGYVPEKALSSAVVKLGIILESGNTMSFSFASQPVSASAKKRNLAEDIVYAFRTINIFSDYNKLFFHPGFSERIKSLEKPRTVIEEQEHFFLRLDIFVFLSFLITAVSGFTLVLARQVIRNPNLNDTNTAVYTNLLYFCLILLACLPLRYAKKPLDFNKLTIKLIAEYSIFVAVLANLYAVTDNLGFMMRDYSGVPDWHVRMFIRSQISRIINMFIRGAVFSVILFLVFIAVGNFIIRRKMKKEAAGEAA